METTVNNGLNGRLAPDARHLQIYRDMDGAVLAAQTCQADTRPYVHPLVAPDGVGVLTENEPAHHPWQHGLYVGLNDVNGHGFWCEGKLPSHARDGTFHPTPIRLTSEAAGQQVSWTFDCAYRGHESQHLLIETQTWTYALVDGAAVLDLEWSLRAETGIRFGEYTYGGLFLRMPFSQSAEPTVLNHEGANTISDTNKKRSVWTAVSMRIAGREHLIGNDRFATVTLMDHPSNPEHPVPWRVDDQFGIAPSRCIAGAWTLEKDQVVTFHHRVLAHAGRPDATRIDESFADFSTRKS